MNDARDASTLPLSGMIRTFKARLHMSEKCQEETLDQPAHASEPAQSVPPSAPPKADRMRLAALLDLVFLPCNQKRSWRVDLAFSEGVETDIKADCRAEFLLIKPFGAIQIHRI